MARTAAAPIHSSSPLCAAEPTPTRVVRQTRHLPRAVRRPGEDAGRARLRLEGEALPPPVVPDRFASVPSRNTPDSTRAGMALGRARVALALAGRLASLPSNLPMYSATRHTPHRTAPRCCVRAPASTYLCTLIRDCACVRQERRQYKHQNSCVAPRYYSTPQATHPSPTAA